MYLELAQRIIGIDFIPGRYVLVEWVCKLLPANKKNVWGQLNEYRVKLNLNDPSMMTNVANL